MIPRDGEQGVAPAGGFLRQVFGSEGKVSPKALMLESIPRRTDDVDPVQATDRLSTHKIDYKLGERADFDCALCTAPFC